MKANGSAFISFSAPRRPTRRVWTSVAMALVLLAPGTIRTEIDALPPSAAGTAVDPVLREFGPLTLDSADQLHCWNRVYQLGAGFITHVKIDGKEALAEPIGLIVEKSGKIEKLHDLSLTVTHRDKEEVRVQQVAEDARIRVTTNMIADNDGFVYFYVTLLVRPGHHIDCIKFALHTTEPFSRFFSRSPADMNYGNVATFSRTGALAVNAKITNTQVDYSWLGNDGGGVQMFVGEDVLCWDGYTRPDAFELTGSPQGARMVFNVEPSLQGQERQAYSFQFGLIATPVKPWHLDYQRAIRVGFLGMDHNAFLKYYSEARANITRQFATDKGRLDLTFSLQKTNRIGIHFNKYSILGIQGWDISALYATYYSDHHALRLRVQTAGRTVVDQTIPVALHFGEPYQLQLDWNQDQLQFLVQGHRIILPTNPLVRWAAGRTWLVLGGQGALSYYAAALDGSNLPLNGADLELPTTQHYQDDPRAANGVRLILEQVGRNDNDWTNYLGIRNVFFGQGWGGAHDWPLVLNNTIEKKLRTMIQYAHQHQMLVTVYTSSLLSGKAPDFALYARRWLGDSLPPEAYNGGSGTERIWGVSALSADFESFHWGQYLKTFKALDIDGMFMDGSQAPGFSNPRSGYPGSYLINHQGKQVARYLIFATRERMKRVLRMYKGWKPSFLIFGHSSNTPFMATQDFCDYTVSGELLGPFVNKYGPVLPKDMLRIEYTGRPFGVPVELLVDGWNYDVQPSLPLVAWGIYTRPYLFRGVNYAWNALDRFGDLQSMTFVPYWDKPLANSDALPPGVYVSAYVHKGKDALLVVSNYSESGTPQFQLSIDPQRLLDKPALSSHEAVDYVRGLRRYPIKNNTFTIGPMKKMDWTMIYVH